MIEIGINEHMIRYLSSDQLPTPSILVSLLSELLLLERS